MLPGAVWQDGLSIPQALNFSKYIDIARDVTYKLNNVFPASKGELESENTALLAKIAALTAENNQQNIIINKLVLQANASTLVSHRIPSQL